MYWSNGREGGERERERERGVLDQQSEERKRRWICGDGYKHICIGTDQDIGHQVNLILSRRCSWQKDDLMWRWLVWHFIQVKDGQNVASLDDTDSGFNWEQDHGISLDPSSWSWCKNLMMRKKSDVSSSSFESIDWWKDHWSILRLMMPNPTSGSKDSKKESDDGTESSFHPPPSPLPAQQIFSF